MNANVPRSFLTGILAMLSVSALFSQSTNAQDDEFIAAISKARQWIAWKQLSEKNTPAPMPVEIDFAGLPRKLHVLDATFWTIPSEKSVEVKLRVVNNTDQPINQIELKLVSNLLSFRDVKLERLLSAKEVATLSFNVLPLEIKSSQNTQSKITLNILTKGGNKCVARRSFVNELNSLLGDNSDYAAKAFARRDNAIGWAYYCEETLPITGSLTYLAPEDMSCDDANKLLATAIEKHYATSGKAGIIVEDAYFQHKKSTIDFTLIVRNNGNQVINSFDLSLTGFDGQWEKSTTIASPIQANGRATIHHSIAAAKPSPRQGEAHFAISLNGQKPFSAYRRFDLELSEDYGYDISVIKEFAKAKARWSKQDFGWLYAHCEPKKDAAVANP